MITVAVVMFAIPLFAWQNVNYWGTGKNRFQLEVPDAVLSRYTPDDYNLASQKKVSNGVPYSNPNVYQLHRGAM